MVAEEKKQILKMVEDGKLTAEQAIELLKAVELDDVEDEEDLFEAEATPQSTYEPDENLENIPLWIGIGFTVLGGLWMFWAMQASGFGFWFYCAWLPFLLGILVVATAAGSRSSRWIFVHIKQAPGERPQQITLGLPLPLRFSAWLMRTFEPWMPANVDAAAVIEILESMADSPTDEAAVIVDVHDDEDGEHVQVFIS